MSHTPAFYFRILSQFSLCVNSKSGKDFPGSPVLNQNIHPVMPEPEIHLQKPGHHLRPPHKLPIPWPVQFFPSHCAKGLLIHHCKKRCFRIRQKHVKPLPDQRFIPGIKGLGIRAFFPPQYRLRQNIRHRITQKSFFLPIPIFKLPGDAIQILCNPPVAKRHPYLQ